MKKDNKSGNDIRNEIKICGDGNCVVRAFSTWLYGSSLWYYFIRDIMIQELIKNKERYDQHISEPWSIWLKKMSENKYWIGHIGIQALTNAYGIKEVRVYDINLNTTSSMYPVKCCIKYIMELNFINGNHYNLVRKLKAKNNISILAQHFGFEYFGGFERKRKWDTTLITTKKLIKPVYTLANALSQNDKNSNININSSQVNGNISINNNNYGNNSNNNNKSIDKLSQIKDIKIDDDSDIEIINKPKEKKRKEYINIDDDIDIEIRNSTPKPKRQKCLNINDCIKNDNIYINPWINKEQLNPSCKPILIPGVYIPKPDISIPKLPNKDVSINNNDNNNSPLMYSSAAAKARAENKINDEGSDTSFIDCTKSDNGNGGSICNEPVIFDWDTRFGQQKKWIRELHEEAIVLSKLGENNEMDIKSVNNAKNAKLIGHKQFVRFWRGNQLGIQECEDFRFLWMTNIGCFCLLCIFYSNKFNAPWISFGSRSFSLSKQRRNVYIHVKQ